MRSKRVVWNGLCPLKLGKMVCASKEEVGWEVGCTRYRMEVRRREDRQRVINRRYEVEEDDWSQGKPKKEMWTRTYFGLDFLGRSVFPFKWNATICYYYYYLIITKINFPSSLQFHPWGFFMVANGNLKLNHIYNTYSSSIT